jgi:large subunit ribosomal protein L4
MSKVTMLDVQGGSAGEYEIADELLVLNRGAQAVQEVIVAYRAGLRAGTASTLGKGQVAGSNRKPWQQKGLGRARAGYRQSPIWRGGGVVFGPKPRSYAKAVPKQVAALAYARALSEKIKNGAIKILSALNVKEGKTKEIAVLMKALKTGGRALLIIEKPDNNLKRAVRNMAAVSACLASDVNVYQLMDYPVLFATPEAMTVLVARLKKAVAA